MPNLVGGYSTVTQTAFPTAEFDTLYVTNSSNTAGLPVNTPVVRKIQFDPNTGTQVISFLNASTGLPVSVVMSDLGTAKVSKFISSQTISVLTSSTSLTVPSSAVSGVIQVKGGFLHHNTEGIAAVINAGFKTQDGGSFELPTNDNLTKFRAIALAGVSIYVEYYA